MIVIIISNELGILPLKLRVLPLAVVGGCRSSLSLWLLLTAIKSEQTADDGHYKPQLATEFEN